jgi:methionyl-tRNA formyltransferase
MRLVFAGTPAFAATALKSLIAQGHEIVAVFCQPDRPAGRGHKSLPGPVKQVALDHSLPVLQPLTLKDPEVMDWIQQHPSEVWVVAAYGLLLPPEVLAAPRYGCLNIHASLLPRWRGAAPIHRAILAGDTQTGVGIMQMEKGLDTGPIVLQEKLDIHPKETTESLHDRLAELGAKLIAQALDQIEHLLPLAQPQSQEGVIYAAKIQKDEAGLNWAMPAIELERQVRAFYPTPGARFRYRDEMIRVGAADQVDLSPPHPATALPGTVLSTHPHLEVATGQGALRLTRLQKPGGRMRPAHEFLQGWPLAVAAQFE